jgi:flavin prenyltransferase
LSSPKPSPNYSDVGFQEQVGQRSSVPISEQRINNEGKMKIIVGITGASGSVYGWRLLEKLREAGSIETHLVISRAGERTAIIEIGKTAADFKALSNYWYPVEDIGARIASGSALMDSMVIAPCSIHSMSAIAAGITDNLLVRAADVTLKERRRLILMIRETPFHLGHLRTMTSLAEMGAVVAPPVPAFYNQPKTISDIVDHSVDRILDLLGAPSAEASRWQGRERPAAGTIA